MTCPVCLKSDDYDVGFGLSNCDSCGHVWQTDLTPTVDYGSTYAAKAYNTHGPEMAFLRAGFVIGLSPYVGGRVVDFGYGNGSFLKVMEKMKFHVSGIDVHDNNDGIVREPLTGDQITSLTFFDSLEHVSDIRSLRSLLRRAINIFVSLPKTPEIGFLENPRSWKHYKPGEHLHYFSHDSLLYFMREVAGVRFMMSLFLEDSIRGKLPDGSTNIMTYHFSR